MNLESALQQTLSRFPFPGYMEGSIGVQSAYSNIARTVKRHLEPESRILDVGCGPCDKTALLQLLGYHCTGYDDLQDDWHLLDGNREKILSFASDVGIEYHLACDSALPFQKASFDMLMLHDVLEHLHDSPRDMLNDFLETVKPGGLLFITVPNAANIRKRLDVLRGRTNLPRFEGFYWYPGPWRGHIREYVKDDLEKLSFFLGLDILELRGCDHMLFKLPKAAQRLYLMVTHLFPNWKDSWTLVARKPKNWTPRKLLSEQELKAILGRSTTYEYSH